MNDVLGAASIGELAGLFASALTSATILPGSSEAVLAAVLALGSTPTFAAVMVATLGNTLGSLINWLVGRFLASFRHHPRFPVSEQQFDRAISAYQRWGIWSLLLSWVPIIGDPLTIVAGVLRAPLWIFLPVVAFAKLARYLAVAGVVGLASGGT
jgi:membrane protein YqaA with SNARE-associated domain